VRSRGSAQASRAVILALVAVARLCWAVGGIAGLTHAEIAHRAYTM
jgi:hypothetical protein